MIPYMYSLVEFNSSCTHIEEHGRYPVARAQVAEGILPMLCVRVGGGSVCV